jgi:hypothetical protein
VSSASTSKTIKEVKTMELFKRINEALATAAYYRQLAERYAVSGKRLPEAGLPAPSFGVPAIVAETTDVADERTPLAA